MTDPGGGFGWRAGSTPYSLGGIAERAARAGSEEPPPICVLLLPRELESFILRDQAEDLLTAPGVVAVEPARVPYGAYLRIPASVADGIAATQARRLRLPGIPRVIVIFHPLQYPLARGPTHAFVLRNRHFEVTHRRLMQEGLEPIARLLRETIDRDIAKSAARGPAARPPATAPAEAASPKAEP